MMPEFKQGNEGEGWIKPKKETEVMVGPNAQGEVMIKDLNVDEEAQRQEIGRRANKVVYGSNPLDRELLARIRAREVEIAKHHEWVQSVVDKQADQPSGEPATDEDLLREDRREFAEVLQKKAAKQTVETDTATTEKPLTAEEIDQLR
jgi:hypothetical protein